MKVFMALMRWLRQCWNLLGISKAVGETTDIVTKEMYSFTDKGGEQICLRPENTAGIARALSRAGLKYATV